jgi:YgiT-type zinc finger domain-containing protein
MTKRWCPECGGEIEAGYTNLEYDLKGIQVSVDNAPADVCSNCGESFLRSRVAMDLNRMVNRVIEDVRSFVKLEPILGKVSERKIAITV